MATVTKLVLGTPRGTVGNLVYRRVNGKTVVSERTSRYTVPMDRTSVNRRSMFALLMKYASAVGSMPLVKSCWVQKRDKGNATFNRIVSANYNRLASAYVIPETLLTPMSGFPLILLEHTLTASALHLVFSADVPALPRLHKAHTNMTAAIILSLHAPFKRKHPAWMFLPLLSQPQSLSEDQPFEVHIPLTPENKQWLRCYKSCRLLCAIIFSASEHTARGFSHTVFVKMK